MSNDPSSSHSEAADAAPPESSDSQLTGKIQLEELIASDTKAQLFLESLDKTLGSGVDETTFEEITRVGSALMGHEALALILGAATTDRSEQAAELDLSPKAYDFVLRVVALYGGPLRRALHASNVPASRGNDWQSVSANSYLDLEAKRFLIDLEIEKFNGEKMEIRASLTSTLILAENILLAAMTVDDMSQITPEHRERIKKLVDELCRRLDDKESDPKAVDAPAESTS